MKEIKSYEDLKKLISTYMSTEDVKLVDEYYNNAKKIFAGMKKKNGDDYISFCIDIAYMMAELKMDSLTIGCSLINEALDLGKMTSEEIIQEFGKETEIILNSISKLNHLKRNIKYSNNAEKYRKIVMGLTENPRALIIKLATRLYHLRVLYLYDKEYQKNIIAETTDIYIPIAHRLGIKSFKGELEDLCLKYSKPNEYDEILKTINANKLDLGKDLEQMKNEITSILNEHNIDFDILYRVKSVYGVYSKISKGKKWKDIYDLLGLRIIVNTVEECYMVIGLIHSKYRPIPKRFKDYIVSPKKNMYQSLHTTVFGVNGRIYEVQVRTYEMDDLAEHGVASHWAYKENADMSKKSIVEEKLESFRNLIELKNVEGNLDFFTNLDSNINKEEIFVFTPKGDVIVLPIDSTPIDFAYKIHSDIGDSCISATVNDKIVKLDYKLQNEDIVNLKTQKGKGPNKSWLKFVKTIQAKSRIRSYFYKKDREKLLQNGKELLQNECSKMNQNPNDILKDEYLNECVEQMKIENIDELYLGIASLKFNPKAIINKILNIINPRSEDEEVQKLINNEVRIKHSGNFIISGCDDLLTYIAPCCNPVYGEEIVGYITKGKGIVIHKKDCKNIDLNDKRIIDAKWNKIADEKYTTNLFVSIDSSNENLIKLITTATKENILIVSINKYKQEKNTTIYELILKVNDIYALNKFIDDLNSYKFITKVERGNKR